MSNNKLLNFQNVNTDKYEYLEPFKSNNCYISTCVYNIDGSNRLPYYYQSPRLYTPTGIYKLRNEFKIDLVIPLDSPFLEYLINEDDKNIQVTSENSQDWFDEHFTTDEVSNKYKTALVFRQSGEDPILRVNIPSYRGKPTCEVFDIKSNPCDWSNVQPDTELVGILEKVGIKFYKEVLTGEYELHKIKVYMPAEHSKLPKGYIFQDEGSDNEEEQDENVEQDKSENQEEYYEDGDNDDIDEDEASYLDNNEDSDEELEGGNDDDSDEGDSDDSDESDSDDSDAEEKTYSELSELEDLEDDLEEVTFTDEENTDNVEEKEDDDETSDSDEFDLSNVDSLPFKAIQNLNDLDDELNDFDFEELNNNDEDELNQDENEESDDELGMESDANEIEQDFEGGHEEELNETKGIQIEELTDDELDLNISDDETDIDDDSNNSYLENQINNELDDIDLSDLEEADLHQEIQQDITRNMIEPEELSDDDLVLDL
jgi:hypothetical protein